MFRNAKNLLHEKVYVLTKEVQKFELEVRTFPTSLNMKEHLFHIKFSYIALPSNINYLPLSFNIFREGRIMTKKNQ